MTGIHGRGRRERISPVVTAGSLEFNLCSGKFHKPCCAVKESERKRKEGKMKDREVGKMAT